MAEWKTDIGLEITEANDLARIYDPGKLEEGDLVRDLAEVCKEFAKHRDFWPGGSCSPENKDGYMPTVFRRMLERREAKIAELGGWE